MRQAGVIVFIASLVSGCGPLPPPVQRPAQLCNAPGGGYVPCNFGYHGSQGPWTHRGCRAGSAPGSGAEL